MVLLTSTIFLRMVCTRLSGFSLFTLDISSSCSDGVGLMYSSTFGVISGAFVSVGVSGTSLGSSLFLFLAALNGLFVRVKLLLDRFCLGEIFLPPFSTFPFLGG